MANAAIEQQDALRRKALEDQAGSDETLQAPVRIGMPETPAAAPIAPIEHKPLYQEGATAADLENALRQQRGQEFIARMLDAGATAARSVGAHIQDSGGASYRKSGEEGVNAVFARRQLADQDRTNQGKEDSADFGKWLFTKLPVTAETAQALGPEGIKGIAGLEPGALIKENIEYLKTQKAGAGKAQADRYDATSAISRQRQGERAAELLTNDPSEYTRVKDLLPMMSYDALERGLSRDQPAMRMGFNPITGSAYSYNRKDPNSVTSAMRAAGGGGDVNPDTGLPSTPKMNLERQKSLLRLGSPPEGFAWNKDVVTGQAAPPNTADVKSVSKVLTAGNTILDFSKRIDDFLKRNPNGFPAGKEAVGIEPFIKATETMARAANDMGVYRAFDQPILDKIVADPTNVRQVLLSTSGLKDLPTQWKAFEDETKQRMWTMAQSAHMAPGAKSRLAGFQPVTALPTQPPAVGTETPVREPGGALAPLPGGALAPLPGEMARVPADTKEVGFRLADGRKVWVPADKVGDALKHAAFKDAKQEGTR